MSSPFTTGLAGPAAVALLNTLWNRVTGLFSLTPGTTISVDISQVGRVFDVTLATNATFNFTGGSGDATLDGKQILLRIKQDATGGRAATWGTGSRFGTDLAGVALSGVANKTDYIGVIYNYPADKYDVIAYARGY